MLLALGLALAQLLAVGYAAVLAGNAAEAGALALAARADTEASVRNALPGWSRAGAQRARGGWPGDGAPPAPVARGRSVARARGGVDSESSPSERASRSPACCAAPGSGSSSRRRATRHPSRPRAGRGTAAELPARRRRRVSRTAAGPRPSRVRLPPSSPRGTTARPSSRRRVGRRSSRSAARRRRPAWPRVFLRLDERRASGRLCLAACADARVLAAVTRAVAPAVMEVEPGSAAGRTSAARARPDSARRSARARARARGGGRPDDRRRRRAAGHRGQSGARPRAVARCAPTCSCPIRAWARGWRCRGASRAAGWAESIEQLADLCAR